MNGKTASIAAGSEEIPVWLCEPSGPIRGGVVVLHEIFGLNESMKAEAARWAEEGYLAIVPDLYFRQRPGTAYGYSDEERDAAIALWADFNVERALADVRIAETWLRARVPDSAGTAAIGFCLGGQLAILAGDAFDAISAFYPVKMAAHHADLRALETPAQVHCGTDDAHIPDDVLKLISAAADARETAELLLYEGGVHGFYNDLRPEVYAADHAEAARAATRALFAKNAQARA